jgi:hypothetical protein
MTRDGLENRVTFETFLKLAESGLIGSGRLRVVMRQRREINDLKLKLSDAQSKLQVAVEEERKACAELCKEFEKGKWMQIQNTLQHNGKFTPKTFLDLSQAIESRNQ